MSRPGSFVPEIQLERSRKRHPWYYMRVSRGLVALLALALIWHLAVYGAMRDRYDDRVKINPITNVMRVPYRIDATRGPVTSERRVVTTRMGREILEATLRDRAKRLVDIYALVIPWRVEFELVDRSQTVEESTP